MQTLFSLGATESSQLNFIYLSKVFQDQLRKEHVLKNTGEKSVTSPKQYFIVFYYQTELLKYTI